MVTADAQTFHWDWAGICAPTVWSSHGSHALTRVCQFQAHAYPGYCSQPIFKNVFVYVIVENKYCLITTTILLAKDPAVEELVKQSIYKFDSYQEGAKLSGNYVPEV